MKNNKGFIGMGLILAIIAVLAIGGGAYYLGTKNGAEPKNVEKENVVLQENQTNPSEVSVLEVIGPEDLNINEAGTWKMLFSGDSYHISVDWGDGKSESCNSSNYCGLVREEPGGLKSVELGIYHEYTKAGTYTFTFTVTNSWTKQSANIQKTVKVAGYLVESKTPLVITFPQKNDQIKTGNTYDIKWTGSLSLNGLSDHYYDVYLWGTPDYELFLGRILAQKGSYTWKVPQDILPGKYILHFNLEGTTAQFAQSNSDYFQITAK